MEKIMMRRRRHLRCINDGGGGISKSMSKNLLAATIMELSWCIFRSEISITSSGEHRTEVLTIFRCNHSGMNSIGRKKRGEASAHFFKIIVSSTQYNELRIPRKFESRYGKGLSDQAWLEVPSGAVQEVDVEKSKGEIWLRRGWDKFMENFSIKLGHFLVFRYDGESCFYVLIFDKSATEIKYPKIGGEDEADVSMEIQEPLGRRLRAKSQMSKSDKAVADVDDMPVGKQPRGSTLKMRQVEIVNLDMEDDVSVEILDDSQSCSKKKKKKKKVPSAQFVETAVAGNGISRVGAPVKEAVVRKVKAFRSKLPSFLIVMRPSYVINKCGVRIPSSYGRKFLAKKVYKSTALHPVGSIKLWRVGYAIEGRLLHMKFTWGWNEFARENHLKIGNVCVFEMMQGGHNHYRVHIFRDEDN
ncbi:B3 domain-containing transcription factor VRN1-like protein [Drosera capensis]